ncbi:hypothetical protein GCM10029992_03710 [Glycomyces albus]
MDSDSNYIHVLSTRLGIGVYDEAWFDYRLTLFENITVPSIRAQTEQDFDWLIVVDRHMPPRARIRLEQAVASVSRATFAEVEHYSDYRKGIVTWSKERAAEASADRILSSRLDDDDALRSDLFERIREEADHYMRASEYEYAVFAPTKGCIWSPSRRRGYTRYHDSHSLGLTVMERTDECRSVYGWPHREIKPKLAPKGAYLKDIDGDTDWWLYAVTTVSDSEKGDGERFKRIMEHPYAYDLDDDRLAEFGLEPHHAATLADLAEPETTGSTKFLSTSTTRIEKEIKTVRGEIKTAGRLRRQILARRLSRLEAKRRRAKSQIVR